MTKEKQIRKEDVLKKLDTVHKGAVIVPALQSNVGKVVKHAEEERDQYGIDSLLHDPFNTDGTPRFTQEQFDALSDEDKKTKIAEGFNYRTSRYQRDAVDALASDPEAVLKAGGKYDPVLAKGSRDKAIRENADPSQLELLTTHGILTQQRDIVGKIENGEAINLPEKEQREIASNAAYVTQHDYGKEEGLNDELADLGGKLASLAPSEEINPETIRVGLNRINKKLEAELERKYGPDFKDKVAAAVGEAIAKMARSTNPELEKQAIASYFATQRGYAPGGQDFKDVYQKAA